MGDRGGLAWVLAACVAVGCGDDGEVMPAAGSSSGGVDSGSDAPGDSSGGSSGDPVDPYDGEPLLLTRDGEWEWFDIDGMACADGRQSGVGVRAVPNPEGLVLYFKGGGACFNPTSCALAMPLMVTGFEAIEQNPDGVLDFTAPDNPLANYDVVYFPYCTGDVHAGTIAGATVEGVAEPWDFVGHQNVLAALERLAPTFAETQRLLVYGTSAGGIGALVNFPSIERGFPNAETSLLDDSGMIFRDDYLDPCLQRQMRSTWGLGDVLPADCPQCETEDGGGMAQYYAYLAERYPDTRFGLVASTRDQITRIFFGFGNNECQPEPGLPDLGEDVISAALADLRTEVLASRYATYVVDSDTHVWTANPDFYTVESGGIALTDWFDAFMQGQAGDAGP